MRHGTEILETYKRMSHITSIPYVDTFSHCCALVCHPLCMSHRTCSNEAWHTYEWVTSHTYPHWCTLVYCPVRMSHSTYINEARIRMSHVTTRPYVDTFLHWCTLVYDAQCGETVHCNTLQHTATHCITLQHKKRCTATYCNTLSVVYYSLLQCISEDMSLMHTGLPPSINELWYRY